MAYELGYIYELFDSVTQSGRDSQKTSEILQELRGECSRIITVMLHSSVSNNASTLRLMVIRHQKSLNILLNKIAEELTSRETADEKQEESKKQVLKHFSAELISLTEMIREFLSDYFDDSYPLNLMQLKISTEQLQEKFKEIEYYSSTEDQTGLLKLLKATISYTHLKAIKASYFQLYYLHELLGSILAISLEGFTNTMQAWINLMIELGFNAPSFYSYCCHEIMGEEDDFSDIHDAYTHLFSAKRWLQRIVPYKRICFHKDLPEIKSSLLNFVEAEIAHIQSLEKIAGEVAGSGKMSENFKVSFTVKELAFFIFLQVECGIILEDKPKKIHHHAATHYSTPQTSKISEKSFKNAYYLKGSDGVKKVIEKLSEMLARSQDLI